MTIEDGLAQGVFQHLVEEQVAVNDRVVEVDDHIAIDDTTVIAAAIDMALLETAAQVSIITTFSFLVMILCQCCYRCCRVSITIHRVPNQILIGVISDKLVIISNHWVGVGAFRDSPTLRLQLQTIEVHHQAVLDKFLIVAAYLLNISTLSTLGRRTDGRAGKSIRHF